MITIAAARERVNRRIEGRLEGRDSDNTAPLEAVAMLCSGTDVIGPELRHELAESTREVLELMATTRCDCGDPPTFNCASPVVLVGMLNRIFWLGWELGRGHDE